MGSGSSRGSPGHTEPSECECSALPMAPVINYATVISPNSLYGFRAPRIISVTTSPFPHPHDSQAHRHGLQWSSGGFILPQKYPYLAERLKPIKILAFAGKHL